METANRLREVRKRRGLNQPELAEKTGLSVQTLYRIERLTDHRPSRATRRALALALNVPEAELFPPREDVPA